MTNQQIEHLEVFREHVFVQLPLAPSYLYYKNQVN